MTSTLTFGRRQLWSVISSHGNKSQFVAPTLIQNKLEQVQEYCSIQYRGIVTGTVPDDDGGAAVTKVEPNISVSLFKNPIVHQLWTARQKAKNKSLEIKTNRSESSKSTSSSTDERHANTELKGKAPSESKVEISYPFATDPLLWESYRNPWGKIRFGKMLEDLDALAGNIAFFHVDSDEAESDGQNLHPIIVTASVDKISLRERPNAGSNQRLCGQVTWTGTSSMEIRMKCIEEGTDHEWLDAYVTFVTLDPITKKPVQIPPVLPTTPEEQSNFDAGAARAAAKKRRRKMQHHNPFGSDNDEITEMAKSLLVEAGPLLNMPSLADPHSILMKNTKMQNAAIAQPQAQNLHNRIFGGFLMRRAFELAFSNAYIFCGSRPIFIEVDEVSFANPVDVGDLLVFNSCVLYTEEQGSMNGYYQDKPDYQQDVKLPLLHVEVEAWVTEPEKASSKLSNLFSFTFAVSQPEKSSPRRIRRVLPSSIDEARRIATRIYKDKEQSVL